MADDLSFLDKRAPNLARMFLDRVASSAGREAFRYPSGAGWSSKTWQETGDQVERIAAGLIALGVDPEQRVAIAAGTRYEWIAADLAIMCAGAATTTVYPSTMAEDVAFILANSESQVIFAEDDAQIKKLHERRDELPLLQKVVTFDGTPDGDWVISLGQLEKMGDVLLEEQSAAVTDRVAAIEPDHLATLVYTSGTTGKPKGVRLRHGAWTYEGAALAALDILGLDDLEYRWLPMSHVFGKVLASVQLAIGYPCVVDGRVDKIIENLAVVQPTFMGAAPRIFEKAYGRIVTTAHQEGGAKAKIFDWAVKVGRKASDVRLAGGRPNPLLAAEFAVADKLVFSKVRARFGGRLKFFISGAAALSPDVAKWFHAAGILILEGWGMTETSAGSTVNRPDAYKFGTIGLPFPGTEVKIADDGEILVKGPAVMEKYHENEQATAETFNAEGYLMTGDIGEIDKDGFVKITDRKKDLFKTSGGKYVAPSAIEGQFKAICPYVSQVMIHGNERNFVSAMFTLDPDAIKDWAKENGRSGKSYEDLVTDDAVLAMLQGYVDQLNQKLNRWEQVKKFIVLDHDLTVESGELTPSLKVKRKVVEGNYQAELNALYA